MEVTEEGADAIWSGFGKGLQILRSILFPAGRDLPLTAIIILNQYHRDNWHFSINDFIIIVLREAD